MITAYFDCQFGAAGDMLLGALLDAGLDEKKWRAELAKIALPKGSFQVEVGRVTRGGIDSNKVSIKIEEQKKERNLEDIRAIIDRSTIDPAAKELSTRIFRRMAEAEALTASSEVAVFLAALDVFGVPAAANRPV